MPRIQFALPERFVFSTELQIYISHVNQGGHLDNAQLLTLVSEARVRFFQALGYREAGVESLSIVVGDIVAQYKSEGFHGEVMRVEMLPSDFNKYGFDIVYRMTEKSTGREVARGKLGVVFVHPQDKTVALVPPRFMERIAALHAGTPGD
ncbi:MAG: hypothetical protein QG643_978 [Pseudomonadota bacterium]|nr:hypothetical protein [Pseudomonadota bacterium]